MHIIKFGGYTLPIEQYEMSESQGFSRRGATSALGGAGGAWDSNGIGPDPLAEDTISKSFILTAATPGALQAAVDSFLGHMAQSQNDYRQGVRILLAQLPDGSLRATWAKCVEARAQMEYYNEANGWLPVQASFRRTWPVWWNFADMLPFTDGLTFADTASYTFGSGGATIQTINTSPATFTITNGGNARILTGVIEFDGAITNWTMENLRNKHRLTWTGSLAAGDRLTLDTGSYIAKKNGAIGQWTAFTLGTERGQITPMVLESGDNIIRITSSSPDCIFRYYWTRGWM